MIGEVKRLSTDTSDKIDEVIANYKKTKPWPIVFGEVPMTKVLEQLPERDRAILRAGELCRAGGFVVVKVAKPRQDMRFDVPTVGIATIEKLHAHGAGAMILEVGRTIMLEKEKLLARADELGIAVVGKK